MASGSSIAAASSRMTKSKTNSWDSSSCFLAFLEPLPLAVASAMSRCRRCETCSADDAVQATSCTFCHALSRAEHLSLSTTSGFAFDASASARATSRARMLDMR